MLKEAFLRSEISGLKISLKLWLWLLSVSLWQIPSGGQLCASTEKEEEVGTIKMFQCNGDDWPASSRYSCQWIKRNLAPPLMMKWTNGDAALTNWLCKQDRLLISVHPFHLATDPMLRLVQSFKMSLSLPQFHSLLADKQPGRTALLEKQLLCCPLWTCE